MIGRQEKMRLVREYLGPIHWGLKERRKREEGYEDSHLSLLVIGEM